MLGICYGMQLLTRELGGDVQGAEVGEFGRSQLTVDEPGRLLAGLPREQTCWMSHRDTVFAPPPGFTALASSSESPVAALESIERAIYGIQFHPEVVHTPYGQDIITRFLRGHLRLRAHVERRVGDRRPDRAHPRPGRRRRASSAGSPAASTRRSRRCSCTARSATSSRACSSTTA